MGEGEGLEGREGGWYGVEEGTGEAGVVLCGGGGGGGGGDGVLCGISLKSFT